MDPRPSTRPQSQPRRSAQSATAKPCLRAALEALILSLLAALLGRRHLRAWHLAAAHLPHPPTERPHPTDAPTQPPHVRTPHDGTHLVCEHPILWVIGPGPNRGLRPTPRATPIARPRLARAPPRPKNAPKYPIRAKPPPTGGRSRTPIVMPQLGSSIPVL